MTMNELFVYILYTCAAAAVAEYSLQGLNRRWVASTESAGQIIQRATPLELFPGPAYADSSATRIVLRKRTAELVNTKWETVSPDLSTATPPGTSDFEVPPLNVSAQFGMTAYLPCSIKNIENKTVSWIRSRDSHILTVDRYIFIADERFQAWHQEKSDTWTLMVKYVQERDEGRYECQVSSEPKMSFFIYFHVVSPSVRITGGSDIYVKVGSPVSMTCVISEALLEPKYIFWYQDGQRVVSHSRQGAQTSLEHMSNRTTVGTLDIEKVTVHDAGAYHCAPEKLTPAKVTLHVINGEHPAAMQHGTSVMVASATPALSILSLAILLILNDTPLISTQLL